MREEGLASDQTECLEEASPWVQVSTHVQQELSHIQEAILTEDIKQSLQNPVQEYSETSEQGDCEMQPDSLQQPN